jgi:hypothetical protein
VPSLSKPVKAKGPDGAVNLGTPGATVVAVGGTVVVGGTVLVVAEEDALNTSVRFIWVWAA